MTLIASLATPRYLIQVGDTRVVRPLDGGRVELVDDNRNKLTYYEGRIVLGYCGLAELEGLRTDLWITREATRAQYLSDGALIKSLGDRAADALAKTRTPDKRLAIVSIGWTSSAQSGSETPLISRLSNFYTNNGDILPRAQRDFAITTWAPRGNEPVTLILTGYQPPDKLVDRTTQQVRHDIDSNIQPLETIRHLVAFVRRCADNTKLVGRNVISVYIPARAEATALRLGPDQPISISLVAADSTGRPFSLMVGGTPAEAATFHLWTEGQDNPLMCGPNMAVSGQAELLTSLSQFLGPVSQMITRFGQRNRAPGRAAHAPTIPRLQLLPGSARVHKGQTFAITCRIDGLGHRATTLLASYSLVVLWHVEQLQFRNIDFGAELGGEQNTERSYTLLKAGKHNPSDPMYAAIVFSERAFLPPSELESIQSPNPTVAKLRFMSITDGPIRLNAGVAQGDSSLLDSAGRPIPLFVRALFLNVKD